MTQPDAPTDVAVTFIEPDTFEVSWTAPAMIAGYDSYKWDVERDRWDSAAGEWVEREYFPDLELDDPPVFTDEGVAEGTYRYRVRAVPLEPLPTQFYEDFSSFTVGSYQATPSGYESILPSHWKVERVWDGEGSGDLYDVDVQDVGTGDRSMKGARVDGERVMSMLMLHSNGEVISSSGDVHYFLRFWNRGSGDDWAWNGKILLASFPLEDGELDSGGESVWRWGWEISLSENGRLLQVSSTVGIMPSDDGPSFIDFNPSNLSTGWVNVRAWLERDYDGTGLDVLHARAWEEGSSEPGSWQSFGYATAYEPSRLGNLPERFDVGGHYSWWPTDTDWIDVIAIGVDGDPAPTEAVDWP